MSIFANNSMSYNWSNPDTNFGLGGCGFHGIYSPVGGANFNNVTAMSPGCYGGFSPFGLYGGLGYGFGRLAFPPIGLGFGFPII